MIILGIETSCDETAVAIVKGQDEKVEVLSNIVSSQIDIHKKYGGVVPEVAAREHIVNILPVINEALIQADITKDDLDGLAVTTGPGLVTSLITGIETAKTLAYAWNKPITFVNHIAGHISANFIDQESIDFPAIILTVSGGHTMLIKMEKYLQYQTIGETRDDAAGEAFDKGAKLLQLGYPGGPAISKIADEFKQKNSKTKDSKNISDIIFPRPMMHDDNYDFSFSGLKTSLLYKLQKDDNWKNRIPEYASQYQTAIVDVLISKTIKAAKYHGAKTIMLAGGVSANLALRQELLERAKKILPDVKVLIPNLKYTTDNAAMIACAGYYKLNNGQSTPWQDLKVDPNLSL